ncbi:MAG: TIGR00289 family protein [Candidatus Woesearchaeota archaeon]
MRLGVLFSGGKDSCYALYRAIQYHQVKCLITLKSSNQESYMFHTPNIDLTKLQSQAVNLPQIIKETKGKKEKELDDLKEAIKQAKDFFFIEGIVSGAIESIYQSIRIQKICDELDLWCFNPLWQKDQIELLRELVKNKFNVIIAGVFAYPFDKKWLGRKLDTKTIKELIILKEKYKINPSGEGGEIETFVLDAPFFNYKLKIEDYKIEYSNYRGIYKINKAQLIEKKIKKG